MRTTWMKWKDTAAGYVFVGPMLLGVLVLTVAPILISLVLSFTEWNFMKGFSPGAIKFTGLANFARLADDEVFIRSVINNFTFMIQVPIGLAISLLLAVLINKHVYFKSFFKVVYFFPYVSSVVAVSVIWMVLFQPSFGPVNHMLTAIGIDNPPKWLADIHYAMPSVIMIVVWINIGFNLIIYMAGLQSIPKDLYEAADIDGAGPASKFFKLTLPLLTPTTFFLLVTGIISSFKVFDIINVLTQGGPALSTSVIVYYLYETAFINLNMGYASAMAWILFILVFIITVIQWKAQQKWVNY
ncbi:sugar ABC transporter permease [Paenibacillus filicis]|uniref:Sugar ABC transporter permease n=1 Tax=Paenibacillus filicis TaxID=669464 RepID=A0ABU9DI48_9BACL